MSYPRWGRQGAGILLIAQSTGRVLLVHRSHLVHEPGTWGLPGGKIEHGETPEDGAIREMNEEIGFDGPLALVPAHVFRESTFTFHNFIGIVAEEFEPELNDENDYAGWFKIGQWPEPLHFGVEELLEVTPVAWIEALLARA